jgi:uncharacterized protein with ParB-like and HNH nuclease domain/predicted transport protein
MKATEAKLLEFLRKSPQFVIPIYQRTYSWTEGECRQLWEDIVRCGKDDRIAVHFIGSIVYIESGLSQVSHQAPLLVIDGQQRLTTVSLLLAALAETVGEEEPFDGFTARKIRNYFLLNTEETGDRHFKLLLSQTDKASLTAIVGQAELLKDRSLRVTENHGLFKAWLAQGKADLADICKGITKLVIVDIALNREQDNPQLIFESMNSTGKELSQADLIRNYVLMGLEPELQTRLYENYWRPMETDFGQEAYGTHFDSFMRHYLTTKTGDIPRIDEVYDAFKQCAQTSFTATGEADATEALVKDVRNFARYFCAMALGTEEEPALRKAFNDLRELKVDVAFPFLLELYADYKTGLISHDDCLRAVRLVEAYVFRRAVCNVPTNSMNKTFGTFMKAVNKERYLESIEAQFLLLPSYRRFPMDEEFHREIQQRDLYNFRSRAYWLRKFENFGRKEFVPVEEYTIEHILPQNENLGREWQSDLGDGWQRIQQTWLHTLGNLTLTAYNAEYSDRPFAVKRDMAGGFKESPLRLNKGLGDTSKWDEAAIKERAARLATQAVEVWSSPRLSPEVLALYREKRSSEATYTREHHPNLQNPVTGQIFDAFRRAVLALDPCVTEEFLKLYVAYKAETNFVDVVPQAKGIRLAINMKFGDIIDPKGLCKDVTNMGRWGNGDVEIKLTSLEDLPYVIGLVRQSLDQQLGVSADA